MTSTYTQNWAGAATIGYAPCSNGGRLWYLQTGTGPVLVLAGYYLAHSTERPHEGYEIST